MNKFSSYNQENNVMKALRFIGQIEKNIFLIDYR
ncbi:Tn3 family transposase [Thermoflavimicrobium dichotomicum]|nr:Tn3 family transposase [Thermoflavimicrobium dichotomicum]